MKSVHKIELNSLSEIFLLASTDFNIVAFNWTPNTLLAEDLENVAKVLEDYNEDTTFWIGDLNFNETYSHL